MILTTDRGIIKLYDGTVVYIVDIQYSHNGQTYWENKYNPNTHYYEGDGVTELEGHKYMRVKHANDLNYQLPMYITATDGDSPELRVDDKNLQWKLSQSTVWQTIYDLNLLKGDKGEEGVAGEGLHIDGGGALDTRPSCCETSTTSSGCSGCGGATASVVSGVKLFVSFGNHKIVQDDIGDGLTYWHYNGAWVQTTTADLDSYVQGWKATAAADANSDGLTCNSLGQTLLFSASPSYDSTGKVYICSNSIWSEEMDLMVTTGQVKMSASDTLAFLNQKVDDVTIEAYDSGVGYEDNIRVKDDGINEDKIISTALGDGLAGGSGVIIEVVADDFVGDESHGLETFTHTDTTTDIRVKPLDLVGDGIKLEGVSPTQKLAVDVNDLVVEATDGLEVYAGGDTFDNLRVLAGDCIELDVNGVNVKADELTIQADTLAAIRVRETDSNTLGIQAKHIHKNAVDETKGLKKANDTTGAIGVLLDATDDSLDVSALGLKVKANGIKGIHLSDDILDNTTDNNGVGSGLILTHDEGLSVKLKDGGGILKDTDGLYLDSLDLTAPIADSSNLLVKSITLNGIVTDILHDDVKLNVSAGNGITISADANSATEEGEILVSVDMAYINANVTPSSSSTAWGAITGTLADQTDLKTALDLKIPYDTTVGNMRIVNTIDGTYASKGLWLISSGGNKFKLYVNDAGQLYTDTN